MFFFFFSPDQVGEPSLPPLFLVPPPCKALPRRDNRRVLATGYTCFRSIRASAVVWSFLSIADRWCPLFFRRHPCGDIDRMRCQSFGSTNSRLVLRIFPSAVSRGFFFRRGLRHFPLQWRLIGRELLLPFFPTPRAPPRTGQFAPDRPPSFSSANSPAIRPLFPPSAVPSLCHSPQLDREPSARCLPLRKARR